MFRTLLKNGAYNTFAAFKTRWENFIKNTEYGILWYSYSPVFQWKTDLLYWELIQVLLFYLDNPTFVAMKNYLTFVCINWKCCPCVYCWLWTYVCPGGLTFLVIFSMNLIELGKRSMFKVNKKNWITESHKSYIINVWESPKHGSDFNRTFVKEWAHILMKQTYSACKLSFNKLINLLLRISLLK